MTEGIINDMAAITIMARSILQLMLLSGGAILCVLTAVIVMKLLGWDRDETDHG